MLNLKYFSICQNKNQSSQFKKTDNVIELGSLLLFYGVQGALILSLKPKAFNKLNTENLPLSRKGIFLFSMNLHWQLSNEYLTN